MGPNGTLDCVSALAVIAACYVPSCAPPPAGTGGSAGKSARAQARYLVNRAKALDHHDQITSNMKTMSAAIGGRMSGLSFKYKTPKSLARKIYDKSREKGIPEHMYAHSAGDVLRYTVVMPRTKYVSGVKRFVANAERQGFKVLEVDNKWTNGEQQFYRGVHVILKSKSGQTFEVQLHTNRSLRVKNELHTNYEKLRANPKPSPRERTLLNIDSYHKAQQNPPSDIPAVETIKDFP